jgi:hypothetical protein
MVMVTGSSRTTGFKYLEDNPGSELNIFLMKNEQKKEQKNRIKTKVEQKISKSRTTAKETSNNNKIIHDITGTRAICTT